MKNTYLKEWLMTIEETGSDKDNKMFYKAIVPIEYHEVINGEVIRKTEVSFGFGDTKLETITNLMVIVAIDIKKFYRGVK